MIQRKHPLKFLLGAIILPVTISLAFSACKTQQENIKKPNLLIIIADQWRGQALQFLNQEPVWTPTLDSFSKHSLVLDNFISSYPVCSPARTMLMTGQYSFTNHVYGNCNSTDAPYNMEMATDAICWSDILKKNGYSLGYIGKWHMDSPHPPYIPTSNNDGNVKWNDWTPPNRRHGFDYWYAYGTYDVHLRPMYWSTNAGRMDFHYVDEWEPKHDVDKAIEYLENKDGKSRDNEKPFGLVVSMNPPHTGYKQVPKKYIDMYKNIPIESLVKDPNIPPAGTPMGDAYRRDIKFYYSCITGDDDQIGRLMGELKRKGLDDNTIVLFIADHGDCLGKHEQITKNNLYEESLRVPFMLYWKGHITPGIDSKCLMSYPDIYPTLLDLMGLKKDIPSVVQGRSWASYLRNGKGAYPTLQYFMGNIHAADSTSGFRGVRTAQYKLVYQKAEKTDSIEKFLYDIKADRFELHNLYGTKPQLTDSLRTQLVSWLQKTKDPFLRFFL